jgi:hypothetical protein
MAERVDFSGVAVIVSLKVDSPERVENLERLLAYYEEVTRGAEIVVVEQGPAPLLALSQRKGLRVLFRESGDCHWKTRNMNHGASVSTRPRLLMSDCDTLPHPGALRDGLDRLDRGADAVQLYNGVVVNVSRRQAAGLRHPEDLFGLRATVHPEDVDYRFSCDDADIHPLYGDSRYRAVGGALLCDRAAFFGAGGWNENLVSYGYDDRELDARMRKLGLAVERLDDYNLYHLDHPRGPDSRYASFYRLNEAEFERVCEMEPEALRLYVNRGFREIGFDHGRDHVRVSTAQEESWRAVASPRVDLGDLVIVVVADARVIRYWASCLRDLMDHLERGFRDYDLRLCEVGGTDYKHIHSKMNVVYRSYPGAFSDAALSDVLDEAGRPLHYLLRLSPDSAAQLQRARALFDRVAAGAAPASVFARTPAARGASTG